MLEDETKKQRPRCGSEIFYWELNSIFIELSFCFSFSSHEQKHSVHILLISSLNDKLLFVITPTSLAFFVVPANASYSPKKWLFRKL